MYFYNQRYKQWNFKMMLKKHVLDAHFFISSNTIVFFIIIYICHWAYYKYLKYMYIDDS
jgi:hypothetical protein